MMVVPRNLGKVTAPVIALALLILIAVTGSASAQHYEGCFANGQQVPDSECGDSGDSGGYSGGGGCNVICQGLRALIWGPSGPSAAEIARGRSNALNNEAGELSHQGRKAEAVEKLREAIAADPTNLMAQANYYGVQGEIDFDAGRLEVSLANSRRALGYARQTLGVAGYNDQEAVNRNIEDNIRTAEQAITTRKQSAQRQFAANEQNLLDEIRPVHATPVVAKATPKPRPDDGTVPNPVSRMPGDPRNYPDLPSYTADQHLAHKMNDDGLTWAETFHDWQRALTYFSAAYERDPVGPFAKVIRENMAIAAKHLDEESAQKKAAAVVAKPNAGQPPATPHSSDAPPKQVLPKTYVECNAEFQSRTNGCQRPDGSWDRDGCFKPAKSRFDGCVKGLTAASFR